MAKYTLTKVDEMPGIGAGSLYNDLIDEVIAQDRKGIFKVDVPGRKSESSYSSLQARIRDRKLKNMHVHTRKGALYLVIE